MKVYKQTIRRKKMKKNRDLKSYGKGGELNV